MQRAFFSSTAGRPLQKTELGPPDRLELPERVKEMDLEKDISYKNKREEKKKQRKVRAFLTMFIPTPHVEYPPAITVS